MATIASAESTLPFLQRLWIYQAERFPLFRTATLLVVFTAASISVSAHLAHRALPGLWTFVVAACMALIFFFQMRACDEVKDNADDCRYRPERPVPRGLVTLRSIVVLACCLAGLAVLLTITLAPWLMILLAVVWVWLALMTAEFFVPEWLQARPFLYLASHMIILPLIDLFVTGTEWLPHGTWPPQGLWLFLVLSFLNGCVLEIGRKVWAPENEREGVETYSSLLGPKRAAQLWIAASAAALLLLVAVGFAAGAPRLVSVIGILAFATVALTGWRFIKHPSAVGQKRIDTLAGLWVLVCYGAAGFAPFASEAVA